MNVSQRGRNGGGEISHGESVRSLGRYHRARHPFVETGYAVKHLDSTVTQSSTVIQRVTLAVDIDCERVWIRMSRR